MHISSATEVTRHRASTSMYSLTFRVRVTKPPQYGRNGVAGASILSLVRACVVRAACAGPGGLLLGSAMHFYGCHSNATHAPIANLPSNAQLGGIPYHSPKLHPVRAIVWACGRGQTDRCTDARDHNTFSYDSREM